MTFKMIYPQLDKGIYDVGLQILEESQKIGKPSELIAEAITLEQINSLNL